MSYIYLTSDIKRSILGGNNKPDLARGVGGNSSISIFDTGEEGAAVPEDLGYQVEVQPEALTYHIHV